MTDDLPRATCKWGINQWRLGEEEGRCSLILSKILHRTERTEKETSPISNTF